MFKKIPLSVPNLDIKDQRLVKRCLDSGWISSAGRFVEDFERSVCRRMGVKCAAACVNGTTALFTALKISRVKGGDEVIVPTLSFIAPVNAIRHASAEPIFMDCDDHMNIDTGKLREFCRTECRVTKKGLKNKKTGKIIKVVLPVHIFGNPCDMQEIISVARMYKLMVIEDAAESIGSFYTKGVHKNRFTGTIGNAGVYSFNGNKIITCASGGMVISNDRKFIDKTKYLINQAKDDSLRYIHNETGYNFRLTSLHAALGMAQFEKLNRMIEIKKRNYEIYKKGLKDIPGIRLLDVPKNTRPNHWFYSMAIDKSKYGLDKEELMRALAKKNIETRPVWHLNHMQKPYLKNQCYKIEKAYYFLKSVLNIPCSTNLKTHEIKRVISEVRNKGKA